MTEDLDRWLAERVMGWIIVGSGSTHDPQIYKHPERSPLDFSIKVQNWHPTSDLNQAFMCVEKMRERGWLFILRYSINNWEAGFSNGEDVYQVENETNPALAICKAIEAALSKEKEEAK